MLPETKDATTEQVGWTRDQVDLIKRTVAVGTTDDEFAMFLHYCKLSGLDPLRKQAHCIVREWTDKRGNPKRQVTTMTGIDGFRARAESFPDYEGIQSGVVFEGDTFSIDYANGIVQHVANFPRKSRGPLGAWAIVKRSNREPFIHYVDWNELFDSYSPMHKRMPEVMAKKTVETQALTHEYTEPLSGMYDPAEIPSSGEPVLRQLDNGTADGVRELPEGSAPDNSEDNNEADNAPVDLDHNDDSPSDAEYEHAVAPDPPSEPMDTEPAPDPPTEAQVERWVDITDWAEEVGLMTEKVHEEALAWLDGPPKRSTRAVGAKIGVWKARKDRWSTDWDSTHYAIKDVDCTEDDKREAEARLKAWVMNPKTRIDGKENTPDAIMAWLNDRTNLEL